MSSLWLQIRCDLFTHHNCLTECHECLTPFIRRFSWTFRETSSAENEVACLLTCPVPRPCFKRPTTCSKRVLAEALPILVLNRFPATARIANFFRKGAAIAGSPGAEPDARLERAGATKVIAKASAFSNPELEPYLRAHGVQELYVLGVFAEGCVRSTVVEAIKLGHTVHVIANAAATNAAWKKRFALWAMKRAGAKIVPNRLATKLSDPSLQRAASGIG